MGKVRQLDRRRKYALVYGDEVENPERPRKYYQDGVHFDGAGYCIEDGPRPDEKKADKDSPTVAARDDSKAERIKELEELHVSKLKSLAQELHDETGAELPEMEGAGLKARLVSYIANNTE